MGCGSWTTDSFRNYSSSKGYTTSARGVVTDSLSAQEMFKERRLNAALDPKGVIRECVDSEEHPNTRPVILALDVTGSMNDTAVAVAKKLNEVMTELYDKVKDVEFMIMGIGDLAYDIAPLQVSQFESDIRIAEQLDLLWFENGGGGNSFESYSAAWYFGLNNTKLDCWNRGQKGIIITLGDERLNPYLPKSGRYSGLEAVLGINLQDDINTKELYKDASEKFDIYHLDVKHGFRHDDSIEKSFTDVIPPENFKETTLDNVVSDITEIIMKACNKDNSVNIVSEARTNVNENGEITW